MLLNRVSFHSCDFSGWHMDCLDPPLERAPPGKWHCPLCPPLPSPELEPEVQQVNETPHLADIPIDPALTEEPFVSSRHRIERDASSAGDSEADVEGQITPMILSRKGKKKSQSKGKLVIKDVQQDHEAPSFSFKRKRLRLSSPSMPVLKSLPTIRLRLPPHPPRSKGKGREEDPEEVKRGLFDDILTAEDRDTMVTSIAEKDRERFDRSRVVEVRIVEYLIQMVV